MTITCPGGSGSPKKYFYYKKSSGSCATSNKITSSTKDFTIECSTATGWKWNYESNVVTQVSCVRETSNI